MIIQIYKEMAQLVPATNHLHETSTSQFGEGDRRKRRFITETPQHWKFCESSCTEQWTMLKSDGNVGGYDTPH
jgi:hypothetical protein